MSDEERPTYEDPHPVHGPRPDSFADVGTIGGEVWSNTSTGGHRLTWRELSEAQARTATQQQALVQVLYDLDRCEHGRHEGDFCSGPHPRGCSGPSRGNPFAAIVGAVMYEDAAEGDAAEEEVTDRLAYAAMEGRLVPRQIGFSLDAQPIVIPGREDSKVPAAYRPRST